MPILIPIYIAIFFLVGFVFFEVFNPSKRSNALRKNLKKTIEEGESITFFDIFRNSGLLLLLAGGAGLLSWSISRVDNYGVVLYGISLILSILLSCIYTRYGKKNANYDILKEVINIFVYFIFGTFILALNTFLFMENGQYLLGVTELLGVWSLCGLVYCKISRSNSLKFINTLLIIVWLIPYYYNNYNIADIFGVDAPLYRSFDLFFILPLFTFCIYALSYAKHQNKNHLIDGNISTRYSYLLSGFNTFILLGSVILYSFSNYYQGLTESIGFDRLDILFAGTTAWLFIVDYICKKTVKNYNANYLTPVLVFVSALTSYAINPGNPFAPFILIAIGYLLYMMADYLRSKSPISQILFYTTMTTHLLIISFSRDVSTIYLLVVDALILIYSAFIHKYNKLFVYYVSFIIPFAFIFRFLEFSERGFIGVIITGFIFCMFGLFMDGKE